MLLFYVPLVTLLLPRPALANIQAVRKVPQSVKPRGSMPAEDEALLTTSSSFQSIGHSNVDEQMVRRALNNSVDPIDKIFYKEKCVLELLEDVEVAIDKNTKKYPNVTLNPRKLFKFWCTNVAHKSLSEQECSELAKTLGPYPWAKSNLELVCNEGVEKLATMSNFTVRIQ